MAMDKNREVEPMTVADHLVILVHGINTRALWMGEIKPALEKAGFSVAPTSYGKYGVVRFLSPFYSLRQTAISRVVADIRTARRAYKLANGIEPRQMSVISHSFGTYVVSRILTDYPEFQWKWLIFCGSVVREDFSFDQILERFTQPLLNEIGTKDFWPALAESAGWGYGSVGSTGFNRPPVETRWHKGLTHSNFLTEEFCDAFWTPFLLGEKARPADRATQMPLWIRAITWLPLRWLPIIFVLAALALGSFMVANGGRLNDINWRGLARPVTVNACERYPALCDSPTIAPATTNEPLECFNGIGDCSSKKKTLCLNGLGYCSEPK
jgi:pimeloyl-ACP methyl ester carboxylesterase